MKTFVPGRPHWWQWPTVLSLDAPAIALLWQGLLASVVQVSLGWPQRFVLGASVWLAYSADRWIEGWRLDPTQIQTQRHYFYQRWRWPLGFGWCAVLGANLAVAWLGLSSRDFKGGLVLLAGVGAYLLSHQLIHRGHAWRAPKEICVALLMGGGVSLFVVTAPAVTLRPLIEPLTLFCLLCFANCALISLWEKGVDEAHGQTSLALQFRWSRVLSRALPWVLAAIGGLLVAATYGPVRAATICVILSGVFLGLVDLAEPRIGPRLARVLADAALLTPLLPLAVGGMMAR
ncbi:MAG: hypothetical protein ABI222_02400 [Opitutaceae bacterium]